MRAWLGGSGVDLHPGLSGGVKKGGMLTFTSNILVADFLEGHTARYVGALLMPGWLKLNWLGFGTAQVRCPAGESLDDVLERTGAKSERHHLSVDEKKGARYQSARSKTSRAVTSC